MSLIEVLLRKRRQGRVAGGLAIPAGAVNGWGTAADFYDSVGVGMPSEEGGLDVAQLVSHVADLGIRHVRTGMKNTWYSFQWYQAKRVFDSTGPRNNNLPAPSFADGGHPIFVTAITAAWGPTVMNDVANLPAYSYGVGAPYTVADLMAGADGGHQHYDGNTGAWAQGVPGAIKDVGAPLSDAQFAFATAEMPWALLGAITNTNEPGGGAGIKFTARLGGNYGSAANELDDWQKAMWQAKNTRTGTGYGKAGVLTGNNRIVTEQGLATTRPNIKQIPVVGFVPMNDHYIYCVDPGFAPVGSSSHHDSSKGGEGECDVGDYHPYFFAFEPSEEKMLGDTATTGFGWGNSRPYFNGRRDIYNGSQRGGPNPDLRRDATRALPMFHTEWGNVEFTDFGNGTIADLNARGMDYNSGGNAWPLPHDIIAEYAVRQLLLSWYWGVRRTYIYQLWDTQPASNWSSEDHLGLFFNDHTKKPSGWAIRNLLRLVGFSEPSQFAKRKLAVSISGYPTNLPDNVHRSFQGNPFVASKNKLHDFQIQQDDNNWLLVLSPQVMLIDQIPASYDSGTGLFSVLVNATAARVSPATQTLTITLPPEIATAQVAWPTRGLTGSGAGFTWASPDAASTTWDNLTITNNQITVTVDRYTKLVKLTATGAPPPPPPPPSIVMTPTLVATSDASKSVPAANSLGAELVRMAFPVTTAASSLDAYMGFYADIGTKLLPVATFNGTMPTQAEAENVATWATRFGPSGTYWSSYSGTDQPIDNIEFGHETSFQYQYGDVEANAGQGDWWNNTTYTTRASNYATRFSQAKAAIVATGKAVGLICQAEDGGSFSSNWVNTMYFAVSNLHTLVSGWAIHSYGPGWEAKMDRMIADTGAHAPTSVPIDITSMGVASDNGNALDDNLGWPLDETYAQAAGALNGTLSAMQAKTTLKDRMRIVAIRDAHDLTASGADTTRDNHFGALQTDLSEKADYSTAVRSFFGGTPPPPPPPPPPTTLPIVVPSVGSTAATLRTGSTVGPRLHLKAVNVWGLRDYITTTFGPAQYQARATVVATIKAWGGNCIRFRMLADDYNNAPSANTGQLTKAQIVQQVKDWRDTVVGQGMYFCPCTWDALDGPFSGASWAANGYRVHQMFADVYAVLGADPMVIYEVTNEPNNITFGDGTGSGQWDTNMRASILYFRETMGYKGVLVIDPINWANSGTGAAGYSDGVYSNIEAYDAARAGMGGKHQIVWAKHDYANEYSGKVWDPNAWIAGAGGSQIKHLIWENEFGNYNGSAATVDATWSQNAAVFFRDRFVSQQNYVGAAPFLFGPWFDANAITASDNLTPTNPWGQTVRTNYLGSGGVTPPPPPVGWSPGIVGGSDWVTGSQASQSLGVKVVRGHDIFPGETLASIDARVLNYFNRGIRVGCLLFNFDANVSTAQAQALATWATRYGPGGSFWPEHPSLNESVLAIRHIEFGNEHSYQYRRGDGPGDASYQQFAMTYALRFRDAAQAIAATGRAVDLLCQGDDGGSGSPMWVNKMYEAVPNLHTYVGGWTVHPYGPGGINKLRNTINYTAAHQAPGTIPLDVTEAGISSDNGRTLSDNYGWPTNLTYAGATSTYQGYLNGIRADGQVGPRLRHWFYYQAYDQGAPGSNPPDRERFFGALQNNLTDKGAFSPYIRSLMAS